MQEPVISWNEDQQSSPVEPPTKDIAPVKKVFRRDGRVDIFDPQKIEHSIQAALLTSGHTPEHLKSATKNVTERVLQLVTKQFDEHIIPSTGEIHDMVAVAFTQLGLHFAARTFVNYREHSSTTPMEPTPTIVETTPALPPVVDPYGSPRRHRLNDERKAITHKFQIGNHEGYITVGMYDETRQPGEIFVTMSKEGTVLSGLVDAFATSISIGLQYGVPLKVYVNKFANMRFEPSGATQNPNIPNATSIVDYIFRWLALKFLTPEERQAILMSPETDASAQTRLLDSNDGNTLL